jgi:hypothetical protein
MLLASTAGGVAGAVTGFVIPISQAKPIIDRLRGGQ